MKKQSSILVLILIAFLSFDLVAQDIHFSQFENTPLALNPALTGMYNGNHRLLATYRDQWSNLLGGDAYRTASISYDAKVRLSDKDYLGLGISGIADKAGALDYGTEQSKYLASYVRRVGKDSTRFSTISFGVDLAIVERRIDLTNARWPSQHDGNGGFDPTEPGGQVITTDFLHFDLASGMVWETVFGPNTAIRLGYAMAHINKPKVSFLDNDETLAIRHALHGSAEFGIRDAVSFLPSFMYLSQGQHRETLLGGAFRNYFDKQKNQYLQIGYWHRFGRTFEGGIDPNSSIVSIEWNWQKFVLGLSYDVSTYDSFGGGTAAKSFEISAGYIFNRKSDRYMRVSNI